MSQPTARPVEMDNREAIFRRTMAGATDILWELRYDNEALSALHDVIEQAVMQREAGENRHDDLPEERLPAMDESHGYNNV